MKSSKAINYTPEYTSAQRTRIANSFLEFYKDGKYAFDPEKKRQDQGYYNHKSEIVNGLDSWCATQSVFVKYVIPIIDYNLETDMDAIEDEWVKQHKLQNVICDLKEENKRIKDNIQYEANELMKEMKKEWVSEVEDVMKLQNALDESEQKRIAQLRKHRITCGKFDRTEHQLKTALEKMVDEVREKRVKEVEMDLIKKSSKEERDKELETAQKEVSNIKKQLDRLVQNEMKYENKILQGEKYKMECDMLKMKKKETDNTIKIQANELAMLRQMVSQSLVGIQTPAPMEQAPGSPLPEVRIRSV